MNTAIPTLDAAAPISQRTLLELLGTEAPTYEALGSGPQQALQCLSDAQDFYALPEALQPELEAFALHLQLALLALKRARLSVEG